MGQEDFRREVLRINARYLSEVVERFDLCPWARSVRNTSKFRRDLHLGEHDDEELAQAAAQSVEDIALATEVEIALLIFPKLELTAGSFRAFVSRLEVSHAKQHPRHDIPLAMASFHPEAAADLSSPARLVPFIRRSPDPTIQLVRRDAMAKVRQGEGGGSMFAESLEAFLPLMGSAPKLSVSDGIAKTNLERVQREGVDSIEAILRDIADDRERSYRRANA